LSHDGTPGEIDIAARFGNRQKDRWSGRRSGDVEAEDGAGAAVRAAERGGAIIISIVAENQSERRVGAIGCAERIQIDEVVVGIELKQGALIAGTAGVGGAVEIAVGGLEQPRTGLGAVGHIEIDEGVEGTGGGHLKNRPIVTDAAISRAQ